MSICHFKPIGVCVECFRRLYKCVSWMQIQIRHMLYAHFTTNEIVTTSFQHDASSAYVREQISGVSVSVSFIFRK